MGALYPSLSDLMICMSICTVLVQTPLVMPSISYRASQQASTKSSSVHLLYLFLRQLSIVLYLIKAFLFAGIVFFFIEWINKIVGISLGKDNPNYHCISLFSTGNPMMPGRKNYVLDDVVILYRLCMVYQMDAHNYSVRSVAGSEQKLVLLCLLSRSYCIGLQPVLSAL